MILANSSVVFIRSKRFFLHACLRMLNENWTRALLTTVAEKNYSQKAETVFIGFYLSLNLLIPHWITNVRDCFFKLAFFFDDLMTN